MITFKSLRAQSVLCSRRNSCIDPNSRVGLGRGTLGLAPALQRQGRTEAGLDVANTQLRAELRGHSAACLHPDRETKARLPSLSDLLCLSHFVPSSSSSSHLTLGRRGQLKTHLLASLGIGDINHLCCPCSEKKRANILVPWTGHHSPPDPPARSTSDGGDTCDGRGGAGRGRGREQPGGEVREPAGGEGTAEGGREG